MAERKRGKHKARQQECNTSKDEPVQEATQTKTERERRKTRDDSSKHINIRETCPHTQTHTEVTS